MDGKISDDEIPDFALISTRLDEISTTSDVLRLWIEKIIRVNKLNGTLFYEEIDKLKKIYIEEPDTMLSLLCKGKPKEWITQKSYSTPCLD